MSALGHKQTKRHHGAMSALPPKADIRLTPLHVRFVPKAAVSRCSNTSAEPELLDHLVGKLLKMQRHVEAEHLGGLEVDDQLELGG